MNTRDTSVLLAGVKADVQGSPDRRELPIQRVGVKGLRYPLRWRSAGADQPSVGVSVGTYVVEVWDGRRSILLAVGTFERKP